MPRSVNAVASRARRKKVMKQAKGYFGRRKNVWTVAKNAVEKAMLYAYRDRRNKKRTLGTSISASYLFGTDSSYQLVSSSFGNFTLKRTSNFALRLRPRINFIIAKQNITIQRLVFVSGRRVLRTFNFDVFDLLNTQINIPLSLSLKSWDFELGYNINLPNALFLHGNVAVGICNNCKIKGFKYNVICHHCHRPYSDMKLLYPVENKNYSFDVSIDEEWKILREYFKISLYVTIFGYSAPKTDINAREILLNGWNKNEIKNFAQIEIIDVKKENELVKSWDEFFVRHHYSIRKSFNSSFILAMASAGELKSKFNF